MEILVCGGRDFNNKDVVFKCLYSLFTKPDKDKPETWLPPSDTFIIHGDAKGVDSLAEDWVVVNWVQSKVYKANWNKYGRRAGYIRNKQMLDDNPGIDLVVAFPGGRGTEMMINLARKKKIKVMVFDEKGQIKHVF